MFPLLASALTSTANGLFLRQSHQLTIMIAAAMMLIFILQVNGGIWGEAERRGRAVGGVYLSGYFMSEGSQSHAAPYPPSLLHMGG